MTREDFIKEVKNKYGDRYDCSLVTEEGIKNNTNVPIRCSRHGMFWITPYQLLNGMVACFDCYREDNWKSDDV